MELVLKRLGKIRIKQSFEEKLCEQLEDLKRLLFNKTSISDSGAYKIKVIRPKLTCILGLLSANHPDRELTEEESSLAKQVSEFLETSSSLRAAILLNIYAISQQILRQYHKMGTKTSMPTSRLSLSQQILELSNIFHRPSSVQVGGGYRVCIFQPIFILIVESINHLGLSSDILFSQLYLRMQQYLTTSEIQYRTILLVDIYADVRNILSSGWYQHNINHNA